MRIHPFWLSILLALPLAAAETNFDFGALPLNQPPPGFRSTVTGEGKPGDWKLILDEVPPLLPPLTPQAPVVSKKAVLAQLAQDPADEHFPLLIFDAETYRDFTLTTRFKTVRGQREQMAGIAFRIQDEQNYYVVRASSIGNTFRFYKVVNGSRGTVIGPETPIPSGVWHELSVTCKGNQIRCLLNGQELIPPLTDNTFTRGKIGFWTKSDSVSYFTDLRLNYIPVVLPAQKIVRDMMKDYPRLLGLKIYVRGGDPTTTRVVGSKDENDLGQPGGKSEKEVIGTEQVYYGKEGGVISVILPLRDRNGDTIAAVRVVTKSFPGQTEENAIVRARPVVKAIQEQVQTLADLAE